jgi:hypothetical protein
MADTLPELLDSRSHLLQELSQFGDFQPDRKSQASRLPRLCLLPAQYPKRKRKLPSFVASNPAAAMD